jgi:phosphate-selective porin OprO/OprP
MKRGATTVLILASLMGTAEAKSLEDVLREKGVITEEDYREVAESRPVSYKPGEGFSLLSPDGRFKTSLAGMLQLRYTLMDLDEGNNTGADQAEDFSRFELRRIKLYLSGYGFSKDLTYRLQLNFSNIQGGSTTNGGLLEETYLDYRLRDELQVRFGQDKVPFGRQFMTSTALLQFPDLAVPSTAFVPGYDIGILLHGRLGGIVSYRIGGYGGVGQNTVRATSDNALAGRLTVEPLGEMKYSESDVDQSGQPLLSFGASYFRDTLNPGDTLGLEKNYLYFGKSSGWYGIARPAMPAAFAADEPVDFELAEADGACKWRGLSLQGEYFLAEAQGQRTGTKLRGQGWYLQGGIFLIGDHLEVAGRYSYLDPNRDVSDDLWVEAAGAVSWYFNKHNLKLQSDYTAIHKQRLVAFNSGPRGTDDRQVRLQAQLLF